MSEVTFRKVEVKTFIIDAIHEPCGGKFVPSGLKRLGGAQPYDHICGTCKAHKWFSLAYPLTRHEHFLT